jgi:hypothetical protein
MNQQCYINGSGENSVNSGKGSISSVPTAKQKNRAGKFYNFGENLSFDLMRLAIQYVLMWPGMKITFLR